MSEAQKGLQEVSEAQARLQGRKGAIAELLERTGEESIEDVISACQEYQGIQEAISTEAAEEANQATSFESLLATGVMDRQFAL